MKRHAIIAVLAGFAVVADAAIIPADRSLDWQPGIPGGTPNRTNLFCNVRAAIPGSRCVAVGDGIADDTAAIRDAVNLCPDNQVVFLPAGIYRITQPLSFQRKSGITLRGDGTKSVLKADFASHADILHFGATEWNIPASRRMTILSGGERGSTSIHVNTTLGTGIAVGQMLWISVTNDEALCSSTGSGGACKFADRDHDGTRNLSQNVRVVAFTPTTIRFEPPLCWSFATNLAAQAWVNFYNVTGIGIEDLELRGDTNTQYSVFLESADRCWVRNVFFNKVRNWHCFFFNSLQCELRDNFFHSAHNWTVNNGYGFEARLSTALLVENNIFNDLYAAFHLSAGSIGCVVAYNLVTNTHDSARNYMIASLHPSHGAHPMLNLFEGNIAGMLQVDNYWGTASHQTFFRNWFTGTDVGITLNRKAFSIDRHSLSNNIVGNVLGAAAVPGWVYEPKEPGFSVSLPVIYRLGYPNIGNNSFAGTNPEHTTDYDARVAATLLRHGNYDYATRTTIWDERVAERALPPSLYLKGKPAWWSGARWPAIGPDLEPMLGRIPAQERFDSVASGRRLGDAP